MITKITKEQEAKIPEYIERYVRMASEPIDRSKVPALIEKIYGEKKTVIFGESIQNTIDLIALSLEITRKKIGKFDNQLHSQLDSQLRSQLGSQLDSQLDSPNWSYYVGIFWNIWLAWYTYGKEIGVQFDEEKLAMFEDVVRNVSNIVVFVGDVIFICEKPLVRWENGDISSDQKMAIEWKDGTGYYYLAGVQFQEDLWKRVVARDMTFAEIMKIEISDQRTVALKYNPQAIIKENAQLIHKDDRNNELYLIQGSEINKLTNFPKMYFLKMLCPTGRTFVEGVEPAFAEAHPNATECQAELCGLTLSDYGKLVLES